MDTKNINKTPDVVVGAGQSSVVDQANAKNGKKVQTNEEKNALGSQDFLKLLITQLQNQDPLNPMDSQQFAVQLAQFSSVEQLISINKKLDGGVAGGGGSVSTMSQFLGKQVTLKDEPVKISQGKGPDLMLDVPVGVMSLRVDFVDKDNKTIGQETLKEIPAAGKQKLSLDGVTVPDGMYDVKVMAVTSNGTFKELPARATGMVEGFVLSPKPALLVGGQEVQVDKVEEVTNTVG